MTYWSSTTVCYFEKGGAWAAQRTHAHVRMAGDAGTPIAATDSPLGEPYARLARRLIDGGMG